MTQLHVFDSCFKVQSSRTHKCQFRNFRFSTIALQKENKQEQRKSILENIVDF